MMKVFTQPALARATAASMLLAIAASVATPAMAGNPAMAPKPKAHITRSEVLEAENAWGQGIVQIGDIYSKGGDYKAAASKFLDRHYAFREQPVLFKPTKAAEDEFRDNKEEALSYFVGGAIAEDHGFAINPWSNVRFDTKGIYIDKDKDSAIAMGNYYFTDAKSGKDVKVDFTMGFKRAPGDGHLELFLHHSSLPYEPQH